jgi:hypothetical protein
MQAIPKIWPRAHVVELMAHGLRAPHLMSGDVCFALSDPREQLPEGGCNQYRRVTLPAMLPAAMG